MSPQLRQDDAAPYPVPTDVPERGHGPWCDMDASRWWVVADTPEEALHEVQGCDADGPCFLIEPVQIVWQDEDLRNEEHEIREAKYDDARVADAYRVTSGSRPEIRAELTE